MKTDAYQLAPFIEGDSPEDTKLLRSMADEVRAYLSGFNWCPQIRNLFLTFGIGGVVGLYLVELEDKIGDQDGYLWVIVGDLPTAYLVADSTTPYEVLETYGSLMTDWADAVESGRSLEDVFPVATKPTPENVINLRRRLLFLKKNVLPILK
ncbi:MAG: hypothetical protein V4672_16290 [Verrucomicrobiota bacterium]